MSKLALKSKPVKKQIKIGDIELKGNVYIPPMAGFTDLPYRILCREFDEDVLMSTEMLSSKAMLYSDQYKNPEEPNKMDIPEGESLTGIQLFGHEPEVMSEAARMATDAGARFIDINMGCPVAKIVNGMDGAALMKYPDLAFNIVKAVKSSTKLPVTVKTRLGWDYDNLNARDLALMFQDLGISALTLHGRTRSQKYEGNAKWDLIAEAIEGLEIPVFANGDVKTIEDVKNILETTGADGVAIARGTMGKPWFSKQVNHYIDTGEILPEPDALAKLDLSLKHCRLMIEYRGVEAGTREIRKHIVKYVHGIPGSSKLRAKLSHLNSYEEAEEMIFELMDNLKKESESS